MLVHIDDILIWAKDKKEHQRILKQVFERAKCKGIKFSKSKCKFGLSKVTFLGHNSSESGIEIDEEKIKAIVEI